MCHKVPECVQRGGQIAVLAMPKLSCFFLASQIDQWNCHSFSGDFLSWISIAEQTAMSLPYTWGESGQVKNDQIACTALISLSLFWPLVCILHECIVDKRLCYFSKTTNREYVVSFQNIWSLNPISKLSPLWIFHCSFFCLPFIFTLFHWI